MKKILLYVALFFLVAMAVIFLFVYNKSHVSIGRETPAFEMTVADLVDAFTADEGGAQRQFVGKVVQVRGAVTETVLDDHSMILRMGDPSKVMGVSCYLLHDQQGKSVIVEEGDTVTVKGICNGVLIDVVLDNGIVIAQE